MFSNTHEYTVIIDKIFKLHRIFNPLGFAFKRIDGVRLLLVQNTLVICSIMIAEDEVSDKLHFN